MKKMITASCMLFIALASCKKEETDDSLNVNCPISEIYTPEDDYRILLTYNEDKIVKVEEKEGTLTFQVSTYIYEPSKITKKSVDSDGESYTYVYNLDN